MKAHAALLYLSVSIALAGAHAAAFTRSNVSSRATQNAARNPVQNPALIVAPVFSLSPAAGSASATPATPHLFPVNDERGLLLTCVAPEIDTNRDTDLFKNCTLAPGRTLDDVMHTFVRAIHYVQKQEQLKDHAESEGSEEKAGQGAQ